MMHEAGMMPYGMEQQEMMMEELWASLSDDQKKP